MATQAGPALEDIKVASERVETPPPEEPKRVENEDDPEREAEPSSEEEKPKPKVTGGFQKRIDKLTRQLRETEEALEAERAAKSAKQPEPAPQPNVSAKPKIEDYEDLDKFYTELSKWTVKQELLQAQQEEIEAEQQAERQETLNAFIERQEEAKTRYTDWEEVKDSAENLLLTPSAQVCIIEAENGPDVLYYLAKHPEAVEKLNAMSDARQAVEIGRISAKLSPEVTEEKKEPKETKIESKAPAPIKPLGGSARGEPKLEDMSTSEFIARRNKEEIEKRKFL